LQKYYDDQDPLNLFIKEKCEVADDKTDTRYWVGTSEFFDKYASWDRNIKSTSNHERGIVRKKMVAKGFEISHCGASGGDRYKGFRFK
jgi:hypothetical protein